MDDFRNRRPGRRIALGILPALGLAGCAELGLPEFGAPAATPAPASAAAPAVTGTDLPLSGGSSAAALDGASAAERAEAVSATASAGLLGTTVATLGTPAEQGFWLKTPLVTQETKGVLRSRETGREVAVTLIPIPGPRTAGSRISLSAMRLLELPLTALAELEVSRAG